jgi:hypothetical protein
MKTTRFLYSIVAAGAVLVCLAYASRAAETKAPAVKAKPGAATGTNTNKVDVLLPVPESVFNVTINPTKDPFFPNSLRQAIKGPKEAPAVNANSFVLMSMGGSAEARLAMINRRTLAVGETVELMTPNGKVKIRLLEIKETSVIIRVISPPQPNLIELTLGGDKDPRVYIGAENTRSPQ